MESSKIVSKGAVCEFKFSNSEVPVIRAGGANLIFFFGVVLVWMINGISGDFGIGAVPKYIIIGAGCFALFQLYRANLSKISITETELHLTCAIDKVVIPLKKLQGIKIWTTNFGSGGWLKVRERKRFLPWYFFFPTSPETTEKLREVLRDYLCANGTGHA